MNVKEKYFSLKDAWMKAQGEQRNAAQRELDRFFASLTEEEKLQVSEAVSADFARLHKVADEAHAVKERIDVRRQLEQVLPFISVSQFAKVYFGRSASWLHQRINGHEVHGKPAAFTPKELDILSGALKEVSVKLANAAACFA